MSRKTNQTKVGLGRKIRSSLVLKLNIKMLIRMLSAFILLNILLLGLGSFSLLWKYEDGAASLVEGLEKTGSYSFKTDYYKLEKISMSPGIPTYKLPGPIVSLLEILRGDKILEGDRSLVLASSNRVLSFLNQMDLVGYQIGFKLSGQNYLLTYNLGRDLRLFIYFLVIIGLVEILLLLRSLTKGARSIRRTLKPLSQLSETAKSINAQVLTQGPIDRDLKDLTGVIDSIDAEKLDRQIALDSSQDELKDLTQAINHMLGRVNDAYQSQIRFVSDASHELRTPISVIQGYANLLDRWGKSDEEVLDESIQAIKGESQAMKELIEQLLFLARGDNDSIELHKEVFDVGPLLDEIIRETKLTTPYQDFKLEIMGPAFIEADRQLIKQAIRILVDNSIKYSPEGESIILRLKTSEEKVEITVQDHGIGIEAQDLDKIFDRFFRSDESRARKTGGSGLGLSIAKWIIERHGADFHILSRVDLGTRVSLILDQAANEKILED